MPAQPVVKGDATSASIGAASILAKVSRDRYMLELDKQYPQYQLAKHKATAPSSTTNSLPSTAFSRSTAAASSKSRATGPRASDGPGRDWPQGRGSRRAFLRETGRGPHHPQLSHPDGGDRPHPAGTGRNTGVLRGKTRAKDSLDTPAAAVNAAKQRRIIASAAWYLQSTHQSDDSVRFDVAEVVPLDSGRWMVHIIKGAFCAK